MSPQELQNFADFYKSEDFEKIHYDWNGEFGQHFFDNNQAFRIELCRFLTPQIKTIKVELIRDIYTEETKASGASFCIYENIHIYAQEMLLRDWKKYLIDYLEGGAHGMDSYVSIGRIEIPKEVAKQIANHMATALKTTIDERKRNLFSTFLNRFQRLAGNQ
jgi:hypothetical protein